MKKLKLTKVIAGYLVVASILALNPIGANAAWKNDATGWWYTEGDSWATGWKQIDGNWYYFNSDGYMEHDTTIDRYCLNSNGAWINTIPAANGSVSFEQALFMAVTDAFPDNNYIEIKDQKTRYTFYYSSDHSGINGNPEAKNLGQMRGKAITYESKEAKSIPMDEMFYGGNETVGTKMCYSLTLAMDGQMMDGYYIEASTGKIYKWHMGHVKNLN